MGHEMAGEIVQVGREVTNLKPGERVVIETVLGDGVCEWCRARRYNICPHLYDVRMGTVSRAFAEYVIAPAHKCYPLPDNVSYEQATLLDTYSVCLHAAHLAPPAPNDRVVVIGSGPIGLGQLQVAKLMGADVIVSDVVNSSLEVARHLGADAVVNSDKEDLKARVMDFTAGRGADIAFECAGGPSMPTTLKQATDVVRRGGKVAIVGGFDPGPVSIPLEWQRIQMGEIRLIPSASYALWDIYPEMQICLDLMAKGKLKADPLITHRVPLDRINEGFETADNKAETGAIFVGVMI
jgi:L-iditol 2-dehydrogenase